MEFYSALSQEQIKQRLLDLTHPFTYTNALFEDGFLAKWNSNDSFYLVRVGMFNVTPLLRFVGEVYTGENVSIIFGEFALPKATKILVACFIGFVWSAVIRTCFLNPNFDILGNLIMFTAISIWTAFAYALFRYVPGILQKKRMEEVIEFIQKNLTN